MKKFKLYNMAQAEKDNAKAMKRQGEHTTPKTDTSTKTVSVKVPGEVYDRLNQIKDEQGFKSQQTKEQKSKDVAKPIADEIADMFSELTNNEPTPWQGSRPTAHKPRKGILYI